MALRFFNNLKGIINRSDLFKLCMIISIMLHGVGYGAYFISNMPKIGSNDDKVYDASAIKSAEVDFMDIPINVPLGGDSNPAPVEKNEWIEGTGKDKPDAESTDININKLSGDGTDADGYMFAEMTDRPPIPIIDFDLNKYFPAQAKSANITRKTVVMQLQINDDGSVNSVKIISPPSGYGFDEAAQKVISRISFRPGRVGGKAVKMVLQLPIMFVLEE